MTERLKRLIREIHRRSLWQVLAIYVAVSWLVLSVVDTLGGALNLPDGFDSVSLVLLMLGLPIVIATAFLTGGVQGIERAEQARENVPTSGSDIIHSRSDSAPWMRLAISFAALFVLSAGVAGWSLLRPGAPQPSDRFPSPFLSDQEPVLSEHRFDLSDDGSTVVYVGPGQQLWVRRWQDLIASSIPGTQGARRVSVSPDGTQVAYEFNEQLTYVGNEILVSSLTGGAVRRVAQGRWPFWAPDAYIYFTVPEGTVRVRSEGGSPESVTRLLDAPGGEHVVTDLLPDGQHALVSVGPLGDRWVAAVHIRTGRITRLIPGTKGYYTTTGHLLVITEAGEVSAARFDSEAVEVEGEATILLQDVWLGSLSRSGALLYSGGPRTRVREFAWVSRLGQVEPLPWQFKIWDDPLRGWSLSPDGTRLAFTADELGPHAQDIFVRELPDGTMTLVADEDGNAWGPRWRRDGESITYVVGEFGGRAVLSRRADGTGEAEILFDGSLDAPEGLLGPDEEWLVLRVALPGSRGQGIMAMIPGVDSVAIPLLVDAEYNATQPKLSPDGRWLAYTSDETGRPEVYVRPFPETQSRKILVSANGGLQPRWSHGRTELFYVSPDRGMWAARYETTSGFEVLGRDLLFVIPDEFLDVVNRSATNYEVSSDDQSFLMARPYAAADEPTGYAQSVLVQNFFAVLEDRVPN